MKKLLWLSVMVAGLISSAKVQAQIPPPGVLHAEQLVSIKLRVYLDYNPTNGAAVTKPFPLKFTTADVIAWMAPKVGYTVTTNTILVRDNILYSLGTSYNLSPDIQYYLREKYDTTNRTDVSRFFALNFDPALDLFIISGYGWLDSGTFPNGLSDVGATVIVIPGVTIGTPSFDETFFQTMKIKDFTQPYEMIDLTMKTRRKVKPKSVLLGNPATPFVLYTQSTTCAVYGRTDLFTGSYLYPLDGSVSFATTKFIPEW